MVCMQCMQCMHCMLCMHISCSGRLEELSFDIGLVHTAPLADKPSMQTQVAVKTELGIAYFKVPPLRPVPPRRPLRPPAKWEPRSCRVGAALVPSGSRARAEWEPRSCQVGAALVRRVRAQLDVPLRCVLRGTSAVSSAHDFEQVWKVSRAASFRPPHSLMMSTL
jgi:hypothetical protein